MAVTNPTHVRTHGGEWFLSFDTPSGTIRERWKVGAGGGTVAEWLSARAIALQAQLELNEVEGAVLEVENGRLGLDVAQNPVHVGTNAGGINHDIAAVLIRWMMRLGKGTPSEQWRAIFALAMLESLIDHIEAQGWTNQQIADALDITVPQLATMNQRINKLRSVDTVNSPLAAARNYLLDSEDWQ